MSKARKTITVLMAEDDPEDRMFAEDAWNEAMIANELHFVEDGEELMDYLRRKGKYSDSDGSPLPGLILLDLNMPKKDGREALAEMKEDPILRRIPVVILTTSEAEEDILRSYDMCVQGYITKPVEFTSLVDILKTLGKYWFEIVELPLSESGG